MNYRIGGIQAIQQNRNGYCCTLYTEQNTPIVTLYSQNKEWLKHQMGVMRSALINSSKLADELGIKP